MSLSHASVLPVLLLVGRAALSQNIAPGYIVTAAGQDGLRGAIVIQDESTQQKQVDFITAQGNQRQPLDARQLKAYGYITAKDTVRCVDVSMNPGKPGGKIEQLFLRQLVAGPAELYQYHHARDYYAQPARLGTEVSRTPNTTHPVSISHPPLATSRFTPARSCRPAGFPAPERSQHPRRGPGVSLRRRRRGQSGFVEATWWRFPADAMVYFTDCPALAPDLQAKHFHARNLPQLVRRHNSC